MNKKLVIIGASGHGKVVADIAKKNGYTDIVFLDDNLSLKECNGYPVVGSSKDVEIFCEHDFIVAIGNSQIRQKFQTFLINTKLRIVTLVHPSAVIGEHVKIGNGTVVMANAVINPCTEIGNGCIINTCASVDHDCVIGDFVHVSVGAHVAGAVGVGARTWIGAGATVSNNVEITSDCVIGAGAVVVKSIGEADTYIGVPAKRMIR